VKPNRNTSVQGLRNVLADERLFLPTVGMAFDLLRIAHEGVILLGAEWNGDG
jgi:hypothetical protein